MDHVIILHVPYGIGTTEIAAETPARFLAVIADNTMYWKPIDPLHRYLVQKKGQLE